MILTEEQTMQLLVSNNMRNSQRYKFSTKFRWKCLTCMKDIYIRYDSYGRQAIFCPSCYSKHQNKETVAQYQYMRKLKEQQLKFVETYVDDFLDKY